MRTEAKRSVGVDLDAAAATQPSGADGLRG